MEPKSAKLIAIVSAIALFIPLSPAVSLAEEGDAKPARAKAPKAARAANQATKADVSDELTAVLPDEIPRRSLHQAGVTLRDEEGREVRAELVSAHGDIVRIKRVDDEREFSVPISTFDEYSKDTIRSWIETDPAAVQYTIAISANRIALDSSTFTLSGRSVKSTQWAYRVRIANQTRNDLNDATVEYRIIYDDKVEFSRTTPIPGKGSNQQEGQAANLPHMTFNDEVEFTTAPVTIDSYEFVPVRGPREQMRDSIKGIWVRVVRHGEIIGEYKSNLATMSNLEWDQDDEFEIKFTNRFRESFAPRSE